MDFSIEKFFTFIDSQQPIVLIIAVIILWLLLQLKFLRKPLDELREKMASSIFYSETFNSEFKLAKTIVSLQDEVNQLRSMLSEMSLGNSSNILESEVGKFLDENIEKLINSKIEEKECFESEIFKQFEATIINNFDKYLSELSDVKFKKLYRVSKNQHSQLSISASLLETLEMERKSAGYLKSFMINLFVGVNLGLFVLYYFRASQINDYAVISLGGLYISLVGFIIYIFKTSNERTSVLLAIKEDFKKQLVVMEYIESKESATLTESDVDFIRIIMVNHAEREKKTEHPYELVLKGVSGTNIQFKGGRMAVGSSRNAEK